MLKKTTSAGSQLETTSPVSRMKGGGPHALGEARELAGHLAGAIGAGAHGAVKYSDIPLLIR